VRFVRSGRFCGGSLMFRIISTCKQPQNNSPEMNTCEKMGGPLWGAQESTYRSFRRLMKYTASEARFVRSGCLCGGTLSE